MEVKNLQKHVRTLAELPETKEPIISCYLNLETVDVSCCSFLDERARLMEQSLLGKIRDNFNSAMDQIYAYLKTELKPDARGAALFARGGKNPFFLPLQFRVPLPNQIGMNSSPNIYPLIELKDKYHRYVVVISTKDSARILVVNLGEVTETIWTEREELRQRIGRGWTKEHYQNHQRDRSEKFIKEKIKVLNEIVSRDGYGHLVLAGHAHATARLQKALPKHLAAKVIDTITLADKTKISTVVETSLAAFIQQEHQESLAAVELLKQKIETQGLATVGADACREALKNGQVDTLILAKEIKDPALREELVKLATKFGCRIETVEKSKTLINYGGVGCLLRFALPGQFD